MSSTCFLDPAILVWDRDEFQATPHRFWSIPDYMSDLMEMLNTTGRTVVISTEMLDCLIETFPADQISSRTSELRDFIRLVYEFIGNLRPYCRSFSDLSPPDFVPDISSRAHLSNSLATETRGAMAVLVGEDDCCVVSNEAIWSWEEKIVRIRSADDENELRALLTPQDIACCAEASRRVYEYNPKHHVAATEGTPIPQGMTDAYMQRLLEAAVPSRNKRRLCAFALDYECYIVFHRHHANRFHGFPAPEGDLPAKGFTITEIPQVTAVSLGAEDCLSA